jgi:hypothetical protein
MVSRASTMDNFSSASASLFSSRCLSSQARFGRYDEGIGSPKSSLESPIIKNRAHPPRTRIVCGSRNLTALREVMPVQDIARPQSLCAWLLRICQHWRRHGTRGLWWDKRHSAI